MQDNNFKKLMNEKLEMNQPDNKVLENILVEAEKKIKSKRFTFSLIANLKSEEANNDVQNFILQAAEKKIAKKQNLQWSKWFIAASVLFALFYFTQDTDKKSDKELEAIMNYDAGMMSEIYQMSSEMDRLELLNENKHNNTEISED